MTGYVSSYSSSRFTSGIIDAYFKPKGVIGDVPAVIFLHGVTSDASQALVHTGIFPEMIAIVGAGFPIVAPSTTDAWGNSLADARIDAALAWARAHLGVSSQQPPILVASSMGAASALDWAADHPCSGIVATIPAVDLQAIVAADTLSLRASINAAWGRAAAAVSTLAATQGLLLPGTAGNYATSPDSVALRTTDDFDIRFSMLDGVWTQPALASIVSKENTKRFYEVRLNTDGRPHLVYSLDGTNIVADQQSTNPVPAGTIFGRITREKATGNIKHSYGPSISGPWTANGTVSANAGSSLFAGPDGLEIGANFLGGTRPLVAQLGRVQIRNNILDDGTGIVFDVDFTTKTPGATSVVEGSSNAATVTINGALARIDKNANPAVQTTALAQVPQLHYYSSDDAVSANIAAYAAATGADIRSLGALGHTAAAVAAAPVADIVNFIRHHSRRRAAA